MKQEMKKKKKLKWYLGRRIKALSLSKWKRTELYLVMVFNIPPNHVTYNSDYTPGQVLLFSFIRWADNV